ncbi:PRC-barrel domain containing protein [bacterium]|nr:MAG: PRC-barrel domain containing protein [bacterium]
MDSRDAEAFLVEAEVGGLNVRSRDGDKLGHLKSLVIDKQTGQSVYAVLSLGGFLGLNKSFYPVPFNLLGYDAMEGDYIVTIDRRILEGGPSWSNNAPAFDKAYADRVSNYYIETLT